MIRGLKIKGLKYAVAGIALAVLTGSMAFAEEAAPPSVDLTEGQLKAIKIGQARVYSFPIEREAVGSIDFNQDASVQVFPPYQGKIVKIFAQLGDTVQKGKPLFTIDSPDLIAAESTLIGAAAAEDLTKAALTRAKTLFEKQGMAEKDYQQAISDEQTADGALRAARDAVRVFGKSQAEISHIISSRSIDPVLVVNSPINGRVTARNAQPGLFVQPGNPPAPFTVADVGGKWMLANVPESDAAAYKLGQEVKVSVQAFPGKTFEGSVDRIAASVDPNSHRLTIRSEIDDPEDELRPNMFASFVIQVGAAASSVGVPLAGVVREGDGTMSVWVTADGHHFTQRTVTIGITKNGFHQILTGLNAGEKVVIDGAIFLSNMVSAAAPD